VTTGDPYTPGGGFVPHNSVGVPHVRTSVRGPKTMFFNCFLPASPQWWGFAPSYSATYANKYTLRALEGESTCEHHRSTGDGGCCDLCDAWIRNPGGQSGWIEGIAGILEAWMVKDVFRIHPKLQFA
jgi:hypothetical protein